MINILTTVNPFYVVWKKKKQNKKLLKFLEIYLKSNTILKYRDNSSQFGIIYTFNLHVYFIMWTIYENTEQNQA